MKRFCVPAALAASFALSPASAQEPRDPLAWKMGDATVKLSIEAGAQYVLEDNAFWNLAAVLAPAADYDLDPAWGEVYVKPGLRINAPEGRVGFRAGVSAVASQTIGRDIFDARDEGAVLLEDAFAGLTLKADGYEVDFSGGAQPFAIGSGMLVSDGAVDGFERGALIFGPRRAWAMTGIAKVTVGPVALTGFHLDPRELPSGETRTIINGARLEWTLAQDRFLGIAYGHVPRSDAPYAQAAPGGNGVPAVIFGAREGLSFVHLYGKLSPLPKAAPGLFVAGDYARQWNDRIDLRASGGRIEIGNTFLRSPWRPTLSYAYQSFSGDDPDTTRLERFDPLFYDGSPNGWATGTNGSFVFINSNVRAHRLMLNMMPSQRDILTFRYSMVHANELRSPLQFGQATRPSFVPGAPGLVSGVTRRKLSDDILIEYTRVLSPQLYLSAGFGHSWAGPGLDSAAFGRATQWSGAFVNIVARY